MRKKILVTTDLSPKSEAAVNKAIDLAKMYDFWLEVLHIVNPPLFEWTWGSEYKDELDKKEDTRVSKEKELSDKIKEALNRKSNRLNVHVKVGSPATEILEFSKKIEADAIVMGGSGEYHPLEALVLGTTTKRVIENIGIPVIVVKAQKEGSYKKILIPTDFSEDSKKAIKFTMELFPDAEFVLLHMMEVPSEFRLKYYGMNESDIKEVVSSHKLKEQHAMQVFMGELQKMSICENKCSLMPMTIESSLNSAVIVDQAKKVGADLISVCAHKINDLTSKLIGNMADDVLDQATMDVLLYQEK